MEELKLKIEAAAVDGKLACKKAFELAQELGVSVRQVGEAANATQVKIAACQLGCFK